MSRVLSPLSPGLLIETSAAAISLAPSVTRFSLRARGDLSPLNAALGLTLPDRIGQRSAAGDLEALRLGPDEWVLLSRPEDAETLTAACASIYANLPHSLVDISAREMTFVIEGDRAPELLTIGCPRDIATIPEGEARRTVFDGATVVLWRDAPTRFRMDCWNSFAPHLCELLETGAREIAAELS
jgi:sarcosine oxidase subunit gamma